VSINSASSCFSSAGTTFAFPIEGLNSKFFLPQFPRIFFSLARVGAFFLRILAYFCLFLGHFSAKKPFWSTFQLTHSAVCPPFPPAVNVAWSWGTRPPKRPNIDPMGERGARDIELIAQKSSFLSQALSYAGRLKSREIWMFFTRKVQYNLWGRFAPC